MKPGTEYELFVKQVYEMLLTTDLPGCDVKHNIKLKGHGGIKHQIDVYWEFNIAGILYRTAVECKDYKNPVSKEKIAAFRTVLDDIGGIRGIYATKVGYQSGAKELAKQYGIDILVIRHPEDKDWKDLITETRINLVIQNATNINMQVSIDSTKLNGSEKLPDVFAVDNIGSSKLRYDEIEPDIKAEKIKDLVDNLSCSEEGERHHFTYRFINGYMEYDCDQIPITELSFDYQTSYSRHEIVVKVNPDLLVFIKDVLQGHEEIKIIEDGGHFNGILQNQ